MNRKMIEEILASALSTGGDFSEVFIEDRVSNLMTSTGGEIENILSGEEYGLGLRIFRDFNSVYVYTNDFSTGNLRGIADEAAKAVSQGSPGSRGIVLNRKRKDAGHMIRTRPTDVSGDIRAGIIRDIYAEAKKYHEKITQVQSSVTDYTQNVLIANSEGTYVEDSRTRCRFSVNAIASDGMLMNNGFFAPGAHKGYEFYEEADVRAYAREASRIAVTMLYAEDCPAGAMPVIIENGFGGVIFHEACGHGLEATSVAKKTSVYSDKLGKQVASPVVTAIDDGTIENAWGSSNYDDEGTKTQKNILIENGILKKFLVDRLNARRMSAKETGSGRRQSYKYAPTSRMTNTYIANGARSLDEMIASIDFGLYAKNMGGGSVNPATGEFNFAVLEGYLIKNGKICGPVRGASLIGKGHEILYKIEMVGSNLDFGQGMCGSLSGSVPANVGQPAIKISEIIVGGGKS